MCGVVLISSYCDNTEKIDVLNKNIKLIKSLGLDVILHSPITLPNYITEECLIYHQTSINPILTWPEKVMIPWVIHEVNGCRITIGRSLIDHGWAALYQVKKLSEIALTYRYDVYHHITYDLLITDEVINVLKNNVKYNFNPFNEHKVGLLLMSFNREDLSRFTQLITKESYLSFGDIVETWLFNLITDNKNFTLSNNIVNDTILYHGNSDMFNYSPFNEFSFFIINDAITSNVKIYFHGFDDNFDINLIVDNKEFKHQITNGYIIDLPYKRNEVLRTVMEYDNIRFDITHDIKNITHNFLSFD